MRRCRRSGRRCITLTAQDDSGDCTAWADKERLAQVLGILINNAIKFTPAAGEINVRVGRMEDTTLYIAISDTGIGIDPTHQDRVFDKFFQVDSSKSRRYEGAGIGLSIAKSIVEAHGGKISLRSAVGQGSTFTIMLPGAVFDGEASLDLTAPASIILVDEAGIFADAVRSLFPEDQLEIRRVAGAAHCLREAEGSTPDLILVNDSPEDIAGDVSIGLLRRDPATARVPILIATAEPPTRYAESADRWPALHYLHKPFTPSALAAHLADILGGVETTKEDDAIAASYAPDKRPRVLVIDSDPGLLEWVELALANREILCYCAATFPAALQMLAKDPPNVLFVDIDAPGAQALDQVAGLTKAHGLNGTPIFVMTGTRENATLPEGVRGVLRKPFAIRDMLALVPSPARDQG